MKLTVGNQQNWDCDDATRASSGRPLSQFPAVREVGQVYICSVVSWSCDLTPEN